MQQQRPHRPRSRPLPHWAAAPVSIDTMQEGGCPVVIVYGEVDLSNAPRLRAVLLALATPNGRLVLDVRGVRFMDCSGLATVVEAALRLHRDDRRGDGCGDGRRNGGGGTLVLRCPSPALRRLLLLTGVDALVVIEDGPCATEDGVAVH